MTAHQDELVVHDVVLSEGGKLSDSSFLSQGQGSAFESRVSELVLIRPAGVPGVEALPDTTETLVSKGFHNLILSLDGVDGLEADPLQALMRVQSYLDNWGGSLRLCDVSEPLRVGLAASHASGLSLHATRDEAIDDYRTSQNGAGEPTAAAPAADENDWGWGTDEARKAEAEGPPAVPVAEVFCNGDELGKLEKDLRKVVQAGKKHVSLRLHFDRRVESNDLDVLTTCRDYLAREGGLLVLVALPADVMRSFRLLEFDREFLIVETGDDADQLHRRHAAGEELPITQAAADESPFVVVSHDRRSFVIRPRALADAASVKRVNETAALLRPGSDLSAVPAWLAAHDGPVLVDLAKHRDATPGRFEGLRGAGSGRTLVFCNASHEVRALLKVLEVDAPSELTLRNGALQLAALLNASEPFEELNLSLESATAADASAAGSGPPNLEFESGVSLVLESGEGQVAADPSMVAELAKAQGAADRLREQVKTLEARLDAQTELRERAQREAEELGAAARRDERRLSELEQARDRAVQQAAEAEAQANVAKNDLKRLEDELARVRQELDGNKETLTQAVAHATRITELERAADEKDRQLAERDAEIAKLRSEAKQVVGDLMAKAKKATGRVHELESSDAEVLRQRVAHLTEEKARILTEAEAEIERLSEEQQLLRSELESAGEMIERLGKELELS